jgi:hypothetical protein
MAALAEGVPLYFNIGRMNPPTPGHMGLIQAMVNNAAEAGAPKVYVFLSSNTAYPSENPLDCEFKKEIIEAMIPLYVDTKGLAVEVICTPEEEKSNVFFGLEELVDTPEYSGQQIIFVMFVGEDRVSMVNRISQIQKLASRIARPPRAIVLEREGMVKKYSPGSKPPAVQQMSASFVKDFIMSTKRLPEKKRLDIFREIYEGLDASSITRLFEELDSKMAEDQKEIDKEAKRVLAKSRRDSKKTDEPRRRTQSAPGRTTTKEPKGGPEKKEKRSQTPYGLKSDSTKESKGGPKGIPKGIPKGRRKGSLRKRTYKKQKQKQKSIRFK